MTARVLQQREGGAALGGAAVAHRQHVRGKAEAVEFDGAAQPGERRGEIRIALTGESGSPESKGRRAAI